MPSRFWNPRFTLLSTAAAAALLASACGGGGGAAPAASSVTLSGYAAVGLALPDATVDIKCATGTATARTIASGFYTQNLSNAALPCVLKVTSADGLTTLHSVAAGSGGGTVVANLTPLTELVMAQAAGQAPAAFFNAFSSSQTAAISEASLGAALARVATGLVSSVAIDTLNPFTAALQPATAASPGSGNAYDRLLDQLAASVANAQTTLAAIVTQVASGNSSNIGSSLESTLAADFAAGIFDVYYDNDNAAGTSSFWKAEVHRSTAAPVNGTYPFSGSRYRVANGAWVANSSNDTNYVLTASGWATDGPNQVATVQQTGLNTFLYTDAISSVQMRMLSSSPATYQLADVNAAGGSVALPAGSKVFDFSFTYVNAQYQLNGGSGFSGVTSLADFRSQHGSSSNPVQWNGGRLAQGALLQWYFGAGSTSGVLYLAVNYPGQNQPVLENGSWEVLTVMGQQVMVLHIPASVEAGAATHSGLATGQKFIYAVTPEGQVQEGRYLPAGSAGESFTNFNRTAANAILAAAGVANLPN